MRGPTSGDADEFDLAIIEDGVYRETFPNLSMDPTAERYIERVLNDARLGSIFVRVIDQLLPGMPVPDIQTVALTGGDDGLASLDDTDFVGNETGKTGLHALDQVQDLTLLIVPGRATPAVHNAMVRYCEVTRDGTVFAVLVPVRRGASYREAGGRGWMPAAGGVRTGVRAIGGRCWSSRAARLPGRGWLRRLRR